MGKFENVPLDEGTIIKNSKVIEVGEFEALHQRWVWEGVVAESLIFVGTDVQELTDEGLVALANNSGLIQGESRTTITRESSGFTFLNMNFENPL